MFKALLKKQFLELNQFYFVDRKKGKNRSKGGVVGMIILYVIIFLFLAVVFGFVSFALGVSLIYSDMAWLYFAIINMIAMALGIFGSVFNTYASLYLAKDNDLLVSMPIPPGMLLLVRMIGVGAMSLLYSGLVWIPAVIIYWVLQDLTFTRILFPIILTAVTTAFVTVITCILGWVIAKIAVKVKKKAFTTVFISILGIVVYYVVYFRMNEILRNIITNSDKIGITVKKWIYPMYLLGEAADGKVIPMIVVTVAVAAIFALVYYIISRSYTKLVTTGDAHSKVKYKEKKAVRSSVSKALFRKEAKRFTTSPTYMLNTGLGLIFIPALIVFEIIYRGVLMEILGEVAADPIFGGFQTVVIAALISYICAINCISAPSVSLEGNSIWILQSMPVSSWEVLKAKEKLHVYVNGIPAFIGAVAVALIVNDGIVNAVLAAAMVGAFTWLSGSFGLMMNLLKPNLSWKNEAIAVKQSLAVFFTLLFGMLVITASGGLWFLAKIVMNTKIYLAIIILIYIGGALLVNRWIRKKGSVIFAEL